MAAISHVFTIRRAAQILGRDEDLLWELSDQLEPEQFAEKLEIGRAMRNIRIQSLMVANLSCVAQTGLESMLPIGTPRKPFSANCYVGSLNFQVLGTDQRLPHLYGWHNGAPVPLPEGDAEPVLRCRVRGNQDLELVYELPIENIDQPPPFSPGLRRTLLLARLAGCNGGYPAYTCRKRDKTNGL